jgi:hypothetical protein
MEHVSDHYLDPPDPPTHGNCKSCGSWEDYGDMTEFMDEYYCDDCISDARRKQYEYEHQGEF